MKQLEKFVIRDQPKSDGLESLLNSIKFFRAELGMPATELPTTYSEAEREYKELISKVEPPTAEQLDRFYLLLAETGGELSGELHSRAQVDLLIRELERAKRKMKKDYERLYTGSSKDDESFFTLAGILVMLVLGVIFFISYSIWPEATVGYSVLGFSVLAFVLLTLWYTGR
ncbi:MAG: hypothetical protein F4Y22_04700 [Gammaproteobacteria bacterium]|nr:hypothetical protein [Gammaproteobacteria bacterium]MYH45122.1 hypothetical protein [Gammaproteobacteria bacterium]MYL13991.1 hypothetical protein [Gammaproteobacteria bacterium]